MLGAPYPTKKALKEAIGKPLRVIETSMFGPEFHGDGEYTVVGPNPFTNRKWFANVSVKNGLIARVN